MAAATAARGRSRSGGRSRGGSVDACNDAVNQRLQINVLIAEFQRGRAGVQLVVDTDSLINLVHQICSFRRRQVRIAEQTVAAVNLVREICLRIVPIRIRCIDRKDREVSRDRVAVRKRCARRRTLCEVVKEELFTRVRICVRCKSTADADIVRVIRHHSAVCNMQGLIDRSVLLTLYDDLLCFLIAQHKDIVYLCVKFEVTAKAGSTQVKRVGSHIDISARRTVILVQLVVGITEQTLLQMRSDLNGRIVRSCRFINAVDFARNSDLHAPRELHRVRRVALLASDCTLNRIGNRAAIELHRILDRKRQCRCTR